MKLSALVALPLATATVFGSPSAAKGGEAEARIGGLISGEVLCSLYRAGASTETGAVELQRITFKLIQKGLIEPADRSIYLKQVQEVFYSCPEDDL